DSGDDFATVDESEPLPPTAANVAITYKRPGDSLAKTTVTKYFGAETLETRPRGNGKTETIVRFDGGVPIWQFKADEGAFGSLTGIGARRFAVKNVQYGKVPSDFSQILPEDGAPEPLDRGSYYVFEVQRKSGSASYQAVKVLGDGSLEAYNAQPRAGSSYLLCCDVTADFPEPVVLPDTSSDQAGQGDADDNSDQSSGDSGGYSSGPPGSVP
ncbi:MAG: hypothetical protein ACRELF_18355, partial [Gemmataceae bacterium]